MVEKTNKDLFKHILTPLTITLGDEFQCLAKSDYDGILLLIGIEKKILELNLPINLHYVLLNGEITTKIDTSTSYGMLGNGLTEARKLLSSKKRDRANFQFKLCDELKNKELTLLFKIYHQISSKWNTKDYSLIYEMLDNKNNQVVADNHKKSRSQIWKRRKTLHIESIDSVFTLAKLISLN